MKDRAVIALRNAKVELANRIGVVDMVMRIGTVVTCKRYHAANTLAPDLRVQPPRN
jgi:hypothetical protein